jgi:hypothetical protein
MKYSPLTLNFISTKEVENYLESKRQSFYTNLNGQKLMEILHGGDFIKMIEW